MTILVFVLIMFIICSSDRCEAAVNLFDQLLLENDDNNELLFLMATAHYNLESYSMGIEFATELKTVNVSFVIE